MNVRLTVLASLSLLLLTEAASAEQTWLADRRYGEGIGIQVGRFELHPGVAAEFGYDSNYFLRADSGDLAKPDDAWRLRLTPSISFSTLTPQRAGSQAVVGQPSLTLQGNAFFSYSQIFGLDTDAPPAPSSSSQARFDTGAGAKLNIFPGEQLGGDIYADYQRASEPSNDPSLNRAFDRDAVRGGAGVSWRPGGGLFEWRVGYEATYNFFERAAYKGLDNLQHSVLTGGRWRILPRSGFLYDARYTLIRYQRAKASQPNGDVLQARIGFGGLVTNRIAFLGLFGWSSTYYEGNRGVLAQNYDGYVGHAELKYFLMPQSNDESVQTGISSIAVGFDRRLSNSYLGAFYTVDRGYLGFDYFLGGAFVANVQGGFSRYSFPRANADNPPFEEKHVDAQLFAEYRFSDVLGLNTTILYDQSLDKGPKREGAPDGVLVRAGDQTTYDNLQYTRIQAYVGLRLFW